MRLTLYILILLEIVCRYYLLGKNSNSRLQTLLLSGLIQSLMIYPILFSNLIELKKRGLEYLGAPFETNIAILFPTIIALIMILWGGHVRKWNFKDVKFPVIALSLVFLYSYITPLNHSLDATSIALLLFLQVLFVVVVCKTFLSEKQVMCALYDAFTIIVLVEFFVCFSYVVLHVDTLQGFFKVDIDETEWIREGTSVRRAYGTTIQPNRLGGLASYLLVFFVSCTLFNYKRTLSLVMILLDLIVVIFSQSRSALMASIISSVLLYLLISTKRGKLKFQKLMVSLLLFAILLIGLFSLGIVGDMVFKSDVGDMREARGSHYILGWLILQKSNFMGVGLNSHVLYMYEELNIGSFADFLLTRAIHSVHLTIFVETGIVGFIAWLYYLVSRVYKTIKIRLNEMNIPILWFTFTGMLFIVIVHGFTDYLYLHYQYIMILSLCGSFISTKTFSLVKHKYLF